MQKGRSFKVPRRGWCAPWTTKHLTSLHYKSWSTRLILTQTLRTKLLTSKPPDICSSGLQP